MEQNLHLICAAHNMIVGHDQAGSVDDESRSESVPRMTLGRRLLLEAFKFLAEIVRQAEEIAKGDRMPWQQAGMCQTSLRFDFNANHGREHLLDDGSIAGQILRNCWGLGLA